MNTDLKFISPRRHGATEKKLEPMILEGVMIPGGMKFGIVFVLCSYTIAKAQAPWSCPAEIHKSDPTARFIRVSDGVTNKMADTKVLPDISDLKREELNSVVVVEILVGRDGDVRCARIQQGDSGLSQRSLDAAQKWHYRAYLVNGEKLVVDTWIRFNYTKDSVEVVLPNR